jgi:diguanylate cyclase (GGDEF)-like protein
MILVVQAHPIGDAAAARSALWVFVAWAAASMSFLALLVFTPLGATGTVALDDYACAVSPMAAGIACLWAWWRSTGRVRLAWFWLACSLFSWAAGEVVWTVYEVHLHRIVPFPSMGDVAYLGFVPLAITGLLCFPAWRVAGAARLRPVFDGAIAAGALLFISWATVLGPAVESSTGSLTSEVISMAYPVSDVLLATIALLTVARAQGRQRVTMLVVSAGLLVVAIADSSFVWFIAQGKYASGNLFDTGYVSGFLLIGVAAVYSRGAEVETEAVDDDIPSRMSLALPYAPLLITTPLVVLRKLGDHPLTRVEFGICVAVAIAIMARQVLSIQMIVALSSKLRDTVAELRSREVELNYRAFHDALTGLANRALFADRVSHALARSRRPEPVFLLLADLDDFKIVNDTMGHAAGDALLVGVADRLRAIVRPEDTVARLGGDEFAILLDGCPDLHAANEVAARIAESLVKPFHIGGVDTTIGASVGVAVAADGSSGEDLLRDADIAMYAAKSGGKGGHAVYAAEMAELSIDRLQLKRDLGDALINSQLTLRYQPIIELDTGRICAVEALLRWMHPVRGAIDPDVFIPLAEASGEIMPIGRWVLQQACRQASTWNKSSPVLGLAVNLSGRQLSDPQLISTVRAALADAEFPAEQLTLEITESALVDDQTALESLQALRAIGLHLAIDDFGTGHSSLSRLRRYPIDVLKVDRSFISALTPGPGPQDVLLATILRLGDGLGIDVIAEGVETESELAALRALGYKQAQGYLFARPADPDLIDELIRNDIALTNSASTP